MKRFLITAAVLFLIATFSGCTIEGTVFPSIMPQPTQVATQAPSFASPVESSTIVTTVEPSPTPKETIAEPTEIIPTTSKYTSTGLGLTFTVPKSWVGKYRVKEGEDYLSVYFNPAKPIDSIHEGEFFTILKKADVDEELIRNDWEFNMNGITYIWGSNASFFYWQTDPEYNTYAAMEKDISDIFQTVRSVSGKVPEHVKRLWIEVFPPKNSYTTTMGLGIAFTLPKSWIGKCRIVESEDDIVFYFRPAEPFDPNAADGSFFGIFKETSYSSPDFWGDSVKELQIDGVTYISDTATDVTYSEEQPEYDTYATMSGDREEILDSVRAVK